MHSPPITPAATRSREAVEGQPKGAPLQKVEAEVDPTDDAPQVGTSTSLKPGFYSEKLDYEMRLSHRMRIVARLLNTMLTPC